MILIRLPSTLLCLSGKKIKIYRLRNSLYWWFFINSYDFDLNWYMAQYSHLVPYPLSCALVLFCWAALLFAWTWTLCVFVFSINWERGIYSKYQSFITCIYKQSTIWLWWRDDLVRKVFFTFRLFDLYFLSSTMNKWK